MSDKDDLVEILKTMRKNSAEAKHFVRELENEKELKKNYTDEQYKQFCFVYVIEIIREYIFDEEDREMLLVTINLLSGFENIKGLMERCHTYIAITSKTKIYEKIEDGWSDPYGSFMDKVDSCIKKLVERLENKLKEIKESRKSNRQKQDIYLGFADEVIEKISKEYPEGLPQKILLPLPKFLQNQNQEIKIPNIKEPRNDNINPNVYPFPKTPESNLPRSDPEYQQNIIPLKNTGTTKNIGSSIFEKICKQKRIIIITIFAIVILVIAAISIKKIFNTYEFYRKTSVTMDTKYENDNADGEKQDYSEIKIIDEAIGIRPKSSSSIDIQGPINECPK